MSVFALMKNTTKIAKIKLSRTQNLQKFRPNSLKYLYAKNMAYTVVVSTAIIVTRYAALHT